MRLKPLGKIAVASALAFSFVFNGVASAAPFEDRPKIGSRVADGTVYAGVSPNDFQLMFTTAANAPDKLGWEDAAGYCKTLDVSGHKDWRLPTQHELDILYLNRREGSLKGSLGRLWYWSAIPAPDIQGSAWMQRFNDGEQDWLMKNDRIYARCVRTDPRP